MQEVKRLQDLDDDGQSFVPCEPFPLRDEFLKVFTIDEFADDVTVFGSVDGGCACGDRGCEYVVLGIEIFDLEFDREWLFGYRPADFQQGLFPAVGTHEVAFNAIVSRYFDEFVDSELFDRRSGVQSSVHFRLSLKSVVHSV